MFVNKGLGTSEKSIEMDGTDTCKSLGDKECLSFSLFRFSLCLLSFRTPHHTRKNMDGGTVSTLTTDNEMISLVY